MILHTSRRELVDCGPSKGRIQGRNGSNLGGSFVVTAVKQAQHRPKAVQPPPKPRAICGVLLPRVHEPCARMPGHVDDGHGGGHASAYRLEKQRERRRGFEG